MHVAAVEAENYHLMNLAERIPRSSVHLTFVTLGADRGFVSSLRARGFDAHALGMQGRRRFPVAAARLRRIVGRVRPQILHSHEFVPTVAARLVGAWSEAQLVVTRHHSDAVHRLPGFLKRRFYQTLEAWINLGAAAVIAPSQRVREILTMVEGVPAGRVHLIPYGQDRSRFAAVKPAEAAAVRSALGMEAHRPALVYVARLHPEKGHVYLFDALARLCREGFSGALYLVGTGAERQALTAKARELGLSDRVFFLGWRDDALNIIAAADMIVHPSLHEALSSAVIEAVALGRPIVASDVSGVRDVLGDSEYGLLVPAGDSDALYRAIRACGDQLSHFARRAQEGAHALFARMDPAQVAAAHLALYDTVASGATKRI